MFLLVNLREIFYCRWNRWSTLCWSLLTIYSLIIFDKWQFADTNLISRMNTKRKSIHIWESHITGKERKLHKRLQNETSSFIPLLLTSDLLYLEPVTEVFCVNWLRVSDQSKTTLQWLKSKKSEWHVKKP